jgi:hypothetical protein
MNVVLRGLEPEGLMCCDSVQQGNTFACVPILRELLIRPCLISRSVIIEETQIGLREFCSLSFRPSSSADPPSFSVTYNWIGLSSTLSMDSIRSQICFSRWFHWIVFDPRYYPPRLSSSGLFYSFSVRFYSCWKLF